MKKLQIANGIALVTTIIINYLSNTGLFNGSTMKTVSLKYHNYFTPAGYAFSIWGLIYLGLLGFVFYTGRSLFKKIDDQVNNEKDVVLKIGWWFVISCAGNSLWVVMWLYDYIGISVLLMLLVLFSLLKIILNTRMEQTVITKVPMKKQNMVWWLLWSGLFLAVLLSTPAVAQDHEHGID